MSQTSVVNGTLLQVKIHGLEFVQEIGDSGGLGREWDDEFEKNVMEHNTSQILSESSDKFYWKEDYQ